MLKELVSWSGKIDQWVKVLVVKSDGQSSSSRTHMEEGERHPPQYPLTCANVSWHTRS